ncbi:hypothetical protein K7472_18985 [Streptomyces sp. PTM05]|uniref:Uncharacterized protein n=1 Tax=Streptantibioticus parmotrematis TaxID=2873249 RepID=A0ABS7QUP0_9ACTN|nr:hypothetical protein [Streptantibioticus parmotrematis]MBY8886927.1 hypothetical protein [Streptantibioticus parmotrematis]
MTTRTTPTALRAAASVAVIASGALLLTACSSSSSPSASSNASASSSSSSSSAGGRQQMAAYTQCLSQHGVKITRPSGRPSARPSGGFRHGGGGGGFGFGGGASANPAMQKAAQACASLRPQFRGGAGGNGNSAYATAFKAFTGCLKDHGVNLPSASPGTMGGGMRGLNTSDPKTAAAYKTCKPLLPQRPSNNPTAAATPSA